MTVPLFDSRSSWQDSCITHSGIILYWWLTYSRVTPWSGLCLGLEITTGLWMWLSFCSCRVFLAPVLHLLAGGLCGKYCWLWVWDAQDEGGWAGQAVQSRPMLPGPEVCALKHSYTEKGNLYMHDLGTLQRSLLWVLFLIENELTLGQFVKQTLPYPP